MPYSYLYVPSLANSTVKLKLKQNNFTETKHCFAFVLFHFCFSSNQGITFIVKFRYFQIQRPPPPEFL